MELTVKRRFAVWLEDAFVVILPDDTDPKEWAEDVDIDQLYVLAQDDKYPAVRLCWEDEHKADLDFPEDEIIVEDDMGNTISGEPADANA